MGSAAVSAARLDDLVRSLQRWAKEPTERQEAHDRESGQKDGLDEETEALLAEFREAADADRADEQFATIAERERARDSRELMERRRARAGELHGRARSVLEGLQQVLPEDGSHLLGLSCGHRGLDLLQSDAPRPAPVSERSFEAHSPPAVSGVQRPPGPGHPVDDLSFVRIAGGGGAPVQFC